MQKPNFFIVGAAKSGTTSLAAYLSRHKHIFMSNPKEPFFFNTDMSWRGIHCEDDYLKLFEEATDCHIAIGEASTSYLYSKVAISNILKFCSDARFIVLLRNPIDMAYSLYSELIWNGQEELSNFADAWSAQNRRERGECIPRLCNEPLWLQYRQACALGTQLERLIAQVPSASIKVVLFDDLRDHTREVYVSVLRFLGVDDDGWHQFEIHNASKRPRFRTITLGLRRLASIKGWTQSVLGARTSFGILKTIERLNTASFNRPPMSSEMRARLTDEFRDEILKLSRLLQRDLSDWLVMRDVAEERAA